MAVNTMGQGTEEPVANRAGQPGGANSMSAGYEHHYRYGDDARWPNVVWIVIGILCVCGLAAIPFLQ